MTIREGRKRHWIWIKLVGRKVCATVGCYEIIKRISWVHPRDREEWCDGSGRHKEPQPLFRRCYLCGAENYEKVRIANMLYGGARRVPLNELGALRRRRVDGGAL